MSHENNKGREVAPRRPHPFELARVWRQEMENDPTLNQTKIAAREGISRARVTQIMHLVHLPEEIQNDLLRTPEALGVHSFPERRLRLLARCRDEATQICGWQELLHKVGNSVPE